MLYATAEGLSGKRGLRLFKRSLQSIYPQDPLLILALHQDDWRQYVTQHPVNVAVFAIKMADHLGFEKIETGGNRYGRVIT